MKKDFSQPFQPYKQYLSLLLQDNSTKKYVLFCSTDPGEEDFYETLSFETTQGDDTTLTIARFLFQEGCVVTEYYELTRSTGVSFSFMDDAPGSTINSVCILVKVDIVDRAKLSEGATLELVTAKQMLARMSQSPLGSPTLDRAINLLILEDSIAHPR